VCLWGKAGATVLTHLFLPGVSGLRVDRVWREDQICHITVTTTRHAARCPLCQRRSKRVHSHYQRVIGDLPCGGRAVVLHLQVRRFVCRVRWCRRTIFTERLPTVVAPSARRTTRLQERLLHDGFDLGGAPGARHATAEGMPVSRRHSGGAKDKGRQNTKYVPGLSARRQHQWVDLVPAGHRQLDGRGEVAHDVRRQDQEMGREKQRYSFHAPVLPYPGGQRS
jgi:zinc-finger of transposase IS204/IS1001/IS1096/IS1165